MAKAISVYTCPISNFMKSAPLNCAINNGKVFFFALSRIKLGVKKLFHDPTNENIA